PTAARAAALPPPGFGPPGGGDRRACENAVKAHSEALDARRLVEERRLFYVAVTRAERVLLLSEHRWPATGEKPRLPSEFLTEAAEAPGAQTGAEEPPADAVNPATLNQATALWPVDPLGARSPDVQDGAE